MAGSKYINNSAGHKFRQTIHHNQQALHAFPITYYRSFHQTPHLHDYGNNPFLGQKTNTEKTHGEAKCELFDTFQFSIIIENSQQKNYFTEKIMDCILTKTIPIYWGCPNISDYFDTTGWIILQTDSIDELKDKLTALTPDYYNKYISIIDKNYETAKQYSDIYINLNNAI